MSIKTKLIGIFATLIVANTAYFAFNASSTAEMGRLALHLYDQVTMVATYAQSAKYHYARYLNFTELALMAPNQAAFEEAKAGAEEEFASFSDDLGVVKERSHAGPQAEHTEAVFAKLPLVEKEFGRALGAGAQYQDPRAQVKAVRAWDAYAAELGVMKDLSALTEQVVADGYSVRLASEEKTHAAERQSLLFSALVLLVNLVGGTLILLSTLPRLRLLTQRCNEIAAGAFSTKVQLDSRDEFGVLARSINFMLETIREKEARLREELRTTSVMLDSLGQGFFLFDREGRSRAVSSKACVEILGAAPAERPVVEVLKIPADRAAAFTDWVELLFSGQLDFEDVARLGEAELSASGDRYVTLEYKPVLGDEGALASVLVVATDKTAERLAEEKAEREREFSRMVVRLFRNRRQFLDFLLYVQQVCDGPLRVPAANAAPWPADLSTVLRALHTVKGGAGSLSIGALQRLAHELENGLAKFKAAPAQDRNLRGELVRAARELKAALQAFREEHRELLSVAEGTAEHEGVGRDALRRFYETLPSATAPQRELREAFALRLLAEPVGRRFEPYATLVQELASSTGKMLAPLRIAGGDLPVCPETYDDLFRSLVHVFRNAVDHGIEAPGERHAAGKPEQGHVAVSFARLPARSAEAGETLRILLEDDGRGIDPSLVRRKLRALGQTAAAEESDALVMQHVFDSGFSTRETVSEISGRGIGMDAVRAAVRALGGEVHVRSLPGQGTCFEIEVPYRLELAPGSPRAA